MASSNLQIQDQHFGERVIKVLKSVTWEHFLQYLRTGTASRELSFLLHSKGIKSLPKIPHLSIDNGLVALPGVSGLVIYLPSTEDFFFRERDADNKLVFGKRVGKVVRYGDPQKVPMDKGNCMHVIGWNLIGDQIIGICESIFEDYGFFETTDPIQMQKMGVSSDYFKCEIPVLNQISKFFIACCFLTQRPEHITPNMFTYAMTESTVISLLVRKAVTPPCMITFRNQMKANGMRLCSIEQVKVGDVGGISNICNHLGLTIETKNRCGVRIPGASIGKYGIMDVTSIFSSSSETKERELASPSPSFTAATSRGSGITIQSEVDEMDDEEEELIPGRSRSAAKHTTSSHVKR